MTTVCSAASKIYDQISGDKQKFSLASHNKNYYISNNIKMTYQEVTINKGNTFATTYKITFDRDPGFVVVATSTDEGNNGANVYKFEDGYITCIIAADTYASASTGSASSHSLGYYNSRGGSWIKFRLYFPSNVNLLSIT